MRPKDGLGLFLAVVVLLAAGVGWLLVNDPYEPHLERLTVATSTSTSSTTSTSTTTTTTIPPTSTTTTAPPVVAGAGVWDQLAGCESGGRWHVHDSEHQGGLQFAVDTWDAYAPADFPADAHLATREQQIAVAIRVRDGVPGTSDPYLNAQGWGAWPHCSKELGLR